MEIEFRGTDRFEIKRRLGAGSMGVVYEAVDRERDAKVALKTLRSFDAQSLYRFKNEFRSVQDLEHPNLVELGELLEDEGRWFFTMELVPGSDFLSHVRRVTAAGVFAATMPALPGASLVAETADGSTVAPMDEQRLRAALAQLALGLTALHRAGKIHRDIKPSNVLVTPEGRVVLLDFGLVIDSAGEADGGERDVVGTAAYMAPEQAASRAVGPAADWYSVGVLLYEALCGRLPFSGSALEMLLDKQRFEPAPPRAVNPKVPVDLDQLCVGLLQFEPAARPQAAEVLRRLNVGVQELAAGLGSSAGGGTVSSYAGSSPFLGRDAELAVLREAFDETRRGDARTVLVHGESGLGKSALLKEFTESLAADLPGLIVLAGRCYERESVPFKAFDGLVDALSGFLRRLPDTESAVLMPRHASLLPQVFPVLGRVEVIAAAPRPPREVKDLHELRTRVFTALQDLLYLVAERWPLILIVDDLQWADADSLLLLGDLLRPPSAPPILVLITQRAGTPTVSIPGNVRHIELGSLGLEAATELAGKLVMRSGSASMASVDPRLIAEEAGGHPLFIDALVRHATFDAGGGGGVRRPVRLDEAIATRAHQASPGARLLVELVSVAGSPLPREVLREAARAQDPQFGRDLSALRVMNLVRAPKAHTTGRIEPFHDRVREAVLARLDPETRRAHHARLAVVLEGTGAATQQPELLLRHLEAAGDRQKAARYAEDAARRATSAVAFDRAAELYRAALRLGDHDDARLRRLQLALGYALVNAGRGREAAEAFALAAEGADPVTRLECRRNMAEQLLISGHIEEGLVAMGELLTQLGAPFPTTPRRALASVVWQRMKVRARGLGWTERHAKEIAESQLQRLDAYKAAAYGLGMVDNIRGADFQARGLLLALKTGEPAHVARFLASEAVFVGSSGGRGLVRARTLMDEALAIARRTGDRYLNAFATSADGMVRHLAGEFGLAIDRLSTAEAEFRDGLSGYNWELGTTRMFHLFALRHMGRYADLARLLDEYVRDASRRGDRYLETTARRAGNIVWIVRGDLERAHDELAASTWMPAEGRYHMQHWFELRARGETALYTGEVTSFAARAASQFAALDGSLLLRIQNPRLESRWLRGRLTLADASLAPAARARAATSLARRMARENIGYGQTWSQLLLAGSEATAGRPERAASILRDAVTTAEAAGIRACAAAARWRLGQVDEARAVLEAEGAADPERLVDMLAPGFSP